MVPTRDREVYTIKVDVRLYGSLSKYAANSGQAGGGALQVSLSEGSTVAHLLDSLGIRSEQRGVTFINGRLSAMPGLQPDLDYVLHEGDRVGFFDLKSMWPFQYRDGAAMTEAMEEATAPEKAGRLHHTYGTDKSDEPTR
jgi:hypothetical protein